MLNAVFFLPILAYVEDIFATLLDGVKTGTLKEEAKKVEQLTPQPMHTMLTKQPREEAIKKQDERKAMVVKDVPPTSGLPSFLINFVTL